MLLKYEKQKIFLKKFWRTWVLFVGLQIPLFWTSGDVSPGFQTQGGSLACVLPRLCTMNSWDSPLVWHLLTSWWPAWQLVAFPTCYICSTGRMPGIWSGELPHNKKMCYTLGCRDRLETKDLYLCFSTKGTTYILFTSFDYQKK